MKKRSLSEEERALWRLATRDVARRAAKPPAGGPESPTKAVARPARAATTPPAKKAPAAAARSASALGAGDPARDRLVASGRLAIDKTIDLHGLTEIGAHRVVRRALLGAAAKGERLLLIITGKGARDIDREHGPGRGVIRRRFLDWIEEPDLRARIARVAQAKPKDGGAGAFYVYLKKKGAGNRRP